MKPEIAKEEYGKQLNQFEVIELYLKGLSKEDLKKLVIKIQHMVIKK